jgi:hypothetical protein
LERLKLQQCWNDWNLHLFGVERLNRGTLVV